MIGEIVALNDSHAERLAASFDHVPAERALAEVMDHLPPPPGRILDVGAGSGRDAAGLAGRGNAVTVAEPAASLRAAIARRLPDVPAHNAALPDLPGLDGPFDAILISGVWHHLNVAGRRAALARLGDLLAPAGRLILSLRNGPASHGGMVHLLRTDAELFRARAAGYRPLEEDSAAADLSVTWLVLEGLR